MHQEQLGLYVPEPEHFDEIFSPKHSPVKLTSQMSGVAYDLNQPYVNQLHDDRVRVPGHDYSNHKSVTNSAGNKQPVKLMNMQQDVNNRISLNMIP